MTCSEFLCLLTQTQDDEVGLQKRFDKQQKPDSEDYWLTLLAEAECVCANQPPQIQPWWHF
jgi:hypothetical protein